MTLTVKELLLTLPFPDPDAGIKRVPAYVLDHPMNMYRDGTMYLYFRDYILWSFLGYNRKGVDPDWGIDRDIALEELGNW